MKGLEDIGSGFTQSVKGKYHNILSKGVMYTIDTMYKIDKY